MTTHARSAFCLDAETPAVLDFGALHGRVILNDERGKVLTIGEDLARMKGMEATVTSHPYSIYAGATGAALWGAFRHRRLARAPIRLPPETAKPRREPPWP